MRTKKEAKKDPNVYPKGLDRKKVEEIIRYYDARKDVDLFEDEDHEPLPEPTTWVQIPVELLPSVRKLIAKHRQSA